MASNDNILFRDADLDAFLGERNGKLLAEIDQFGSDYVLKVNFDDLIAHLTDKYQIEPVTVLRDQTHIGDHGDTKLDVSGNPRYDWDYREGPLLIPATFAEFAVPFTGDATLLRLRPSSFNLNPPRGRVVGQELRFNYKQADHDNAAMRQEFDRDVENVERYVAWGREQVTQYNNALPERIRQRLQHRKEKFLKDKGMVEGLGIPIKPRAGAPATYAAPVTRKKLPIHRPTVCAEPFKPEPRLEMEHYEHILSVVSNMVLVMERSPQAFSKMDEESLRTHILVQLNAQYEGQATGETFNGEGKTDILIRAEGRNIFIAECKFWKGPGVFTKTIDQLLGYAAWRDTKTAIVVFNRNKDTSAVLAQIPALVKAHPNFKREVTNYQTETGFRFHLHHRDDKNKELILTVVVFDVPA